MQETELLRAIDAFIEENKHAVVRDIKRVVDIASVEGEPLPNAPFGAKVDEALQTALSMAQEMGLAPHNMNGWFGYADLPGKSKKQLAAITHLDVVPAGNGWTHDPFDMIEKEGYLLGRGVVDDKGPAILTLYAAKFFAKRGEALPYTLRLLFGTNEESGMRGLKYYLAHETPPAFCFTPDAEFPVCYGEKGHYGVDLCSGPLTGNLVAFTGGVAGNVVPDRATALVRAQLAALPKANNIVLEDAGSGLVRITAYGKGGHASMPEGTVNAIYMVVRYLLENDLCSESETKFFTMLRKILGVTDGSTLGIAAKDDIFTPLTCIGGVISFMDGVVTQNIDIRYPTSITATQITQAFERIMQEVGGTMKNAQSTTPFVTSAETLAVQTLIRTYNDVTGKHEKPFTMGGGTYARDFPCAVSFGIEEPGEDQPAWVGTMHGADEGVSKELLWKALKIYILGIARLMELEL